MVARIVLDFEGFGAVEAELLDATNPRTSKAILESLPFASDASVWGKEVYFEVPVSTPAENGVRTVSAGDIAFWPPGRALCLFFGPTPASRDERPVAASPVSVVGRIVTNVALLEEVTAGTKVRAKLAENGRDR